MEKIKSLFIALLISSSALFANDNTWKSVDSEIKQVFVPNKSTNKIESIAELIIQLTIHSIFKKEGDLSTIFPPRRITALHDNETNSRIIIEAANALLYSKGDIKSILTENVHSFAKKSGHTWVFNLLS